MQDAEPSPYDLIPTWRDGVLTRFDKLEAHRLGLRHKAISVFLIHDGRLLMQRRALGKYHSGGLWANTVCTHPFWGEAAEDCARRRMAEELGIEGVEPVLVGQVEYRADVENGLVEHEVVDLLLVRVDEPPEVRPNPDEVMAVEWQPVEGLAGRVNAAPEDHTAWLRIYVAEHSGLIFG